MSIKVKKLDKVSTQIVEAYNNGMSMDAIATTHGVSKGTVRNTLISNGVVPRKRGRPKMQPILDEVFGGTE